MPSMCSRRTVAATFCLSLRTSAVAGPITVAIVLSPPASRFSLPASHTHRHAAAVVPEGVGAASGAAVGVVVIELLSLDQRSLLVLLVEEQQLGRFAVQPQFLPFAGDLVRHLLANGRALGEHVQVAVLAAGVDERLGAPRPLLG